MKFQDRFAFDHPVARMMHVFTDVDYYRRKYDRLGGNPAIESSADDGDRFEIVVRHELDTSGSKIPDLLRKRIGDRLNLRQQEIWTRSNRTGRVHIDVVGAPASAELVLHLRDAGDGAELHLDFDIEVAIPLVGSRVEKGIAGPITRHMHKDLRLTNKMAADYMDV
ncbi:DUF2505 domain-containing protein [Salinisphaera sp. USBA-960]|uniref:DUF2505 domain-containing protein n=1 Tax=Salinisphaera orenii TaxID=856731 RepID=UPI000DBE5AAD|nr:DUF2505 domain-containing protein [Salifodinibacter halophilus]NNC25706.1 DUF2505 domain-containing protein [Salifodinibacter halophilus]